MDFWAPTVDDSARCLANKWHSVTHLTVLKYTLQSVHCQRATQSIENNLARHESWRGNWEKDKRISIINNWLWANIWIIEILLPNRRVHKEIPLNFNLKASLPFLELFNTRHKLSCFKTKELIKANIKQCKEVLRQLALQKILSLIAVCLEFNLD